MGWSSSPDGRDYWRQLRDMKGSAEVETMSAAALKLYAGMCGWSLARAHDRSGPAGAIANHLGASIAFDRAVADFAARYAALNESAFPRHAEAVGHGRISRLAAPA